MANKVIFLCPYILSSLILLPGVENAKLGLTIELIHRDSLESPLYQPNLTPAQRTQNLVLQSKARVKRPRNESLQPNSFNSGTNFVRPKVDYQKGATFMVQVSIGTFRMSQPISFFLDMDTGSDLMWLQCQECKDPGHHSFHQNKPVFNHSQSSSYRTLVCDRHPLCFPGKCIGNFCSYHIVYDDEATTEGYLASETFTFESYSTRSEGLPNIIFGCGINQIGMDAYGEEGGNVAGILGLGWSPHSLVSQLGSISQGRFSHCLQRMPYDHHSPNTYLRFGAGIPNRPSFQQTELVKFDRLTPYFLNMLDISVASSHLHIPSEHFARRPQFRGGTLIDTGTAYSGIFQPAYEILEQALVNYFSRYRKIARIHREDFNLCYQRSTVRREGYMNLPTITFHLRGADLLLQPQAAFFVDLTGQSYRREYFCLAMFNESDDSVIGAYQQTISIYDLGRRTLRFGPEDCSRTP